MTFTINGIEWSVKFVHPMSKELLRSDLSRTVGVTDFPKRTVFLSNLLRGEFLRRVVAHELCHCYCFSNNCYIDIEEEERLANWVSLYAEDLVDTLRYIMPMLKYAVA